MHQLGLTDDQIELGQFETAVFRLQQEFLRDAGTPAPKPARNRLVHTSQDIHQDHQTVTQEATRAFRGTTVLGFDVLRSSYGFFPHFLAEVSERAVENKIAALNKYATYSNRYYFSPDIMRATAIRHGALAERPYARRI
jgi:LmbE family N-acetylglucosaminyl deacetylase